MLKAINTIKFYYLNEKKTNVVTARWDAINVTVEVQYDVAFLRVHFYDTTK